MGMARPAAVCIGRAVLDGGDAPRLESGFRRPESCRSLGSRCRISVHAIVCMAACVVSSATEGPRFAGLIVIFRTMRRHRGTDLRAHGADAPTANEPRDPSTLRLPARRPCSVTHSGGCGYAGIRLLCTTRSALGGPRMARARRADVLEFRLMGMDHLCRFLCVHVEPVLGHDVGRYLPASLSSAPVNHEA